MTNAVLIGGPCDGSELQLGAPYPGIIVGAPVQPMPSGLIDNIREILAGPPAVLFAEYEFAGADAETLLWRYEFTRERSL